MKRISSFTWNRIKIKCKFHSPLDLWWDFWSLWKVIALWLESILISNVGDTDQVAIRVSVAVFALSNLKDVIAN